MILRRDGLRLAVCLVVVVTNVRASLVEVRFDTGELMRDADPGSQVLFEAPLRANRKNPAQVMVSIANEEAADAFGVFPTVLAPGDPFTLILRDPELIPVMNSDNTFQIPLTVRFLEENNQSSEVATAATENFTLSVHFLTAPPEVPRIWKSEQTFKLNRKLTEGIVGKIGVKNLEKTDLSEFKYELFGGFTELFYIETVKEGLLFKTTGCETATCHRLPANFTLLLRVTPAAAGNYHNRTEIALFHLEIIPDANPPMQLTQTEYFANILEHASHFVEAVQVEVLSSTSSDSEVTFRLSEPSDVFAIDVHTGLLSVKNSSLVTRANLGHTANLSVVVQGSGDRKAEARVLVTVLEESSQEHTDAPLEGFEFEEPIYAFAVGPKQSIVGRIALLPGVQGELRIVEGGAGNFELSADGTLTYHGPVERVARNYTLKVIAVPKQSSSTIALTTVQILVAGIGSNFPFFENAYETAVVESTTVRETPVLQLTARDFDQDASLVYGLVSTVCRDFLSNEVPCADEFILNPGGQIVVGSLDSNVSHVAMNVSVQDKSHRLEMKDYCFVSLIVRRPASVMDMKKVFRFEQVSEPQVVADDVPVGTYLFTAVMLPLSVANEEKLKPNITFSFLKAPPEFRINANTGMIFTTKSLKNLGSQVVTVLADVVTTEGEQKATTEMRFDVVPMDVESPVILNQPDALNDAIRFSVNENAELGKEVGRIIATKSVDGGNNTFALLGDENMLQTLRIDEHGEIRVAGPIDFETNKKLNCFVKVINGVEKSAVAPVTVRVVNLNDNPPEFPFPEFMFDILENMPVGSFLGRAHAMDKDGDKIAYTLRFPDNSALTDRVSVDSKGFLFSSAPLHGLNGTFPVTVVATDREFSSELPILFNITATSKCQPVFLAGQMDVFDVDKNAKPGSLVGTLIATVDDSPDCSPLAFRVEFIPNTPLVNVSATDLDSLFAVDTASGKISTHAPLHSFEGFRFPVVIVAASGNLVTRRAAEIRISSHERQKPVFQMRHVRIEMSENNPENSTLGEFVAVATGERLHYRLADDFGGKFVVEEDMGRLSVRQSLNREENGFFRIKIQASTDAGFAEALTDEMTVNLVVRDVNDNGPQFERPSYELTLDTETVSGTEIHTVTAKDPDLGPNVVVYALDSVVFKYKGRDTPIRGVFDISPENGRIRAIKRVDSFSGGLFQLAVTASDKSSDEVAHIAHTVVNVWVVNKYEHTIPTLIHQNPVQLTTTQLRRYSTKLSSAINGTILLFALRFYELPSESGSGHPMIARDSTLAEFVAVDRHVSEVLSWKSVRNAIKDLSIDGMSLLSGTPASMSTHRPQTAMSAESSLALLAVVFALLLLVIMSILGIILCYYRRKFRTQRQKLIDAKIVAATVNRPPVRNWSPYLERQPELLWERSSTDSPGSSTPERRSSYSVQEMKIAVFS